MILFLRMSFVSHPLLKKDVIEQRAYQEALVERLQHHPHALVVMPTSLGKTILAVQLAAHVLLEKPKQKVLILAPTKPLAVQHEQSFKSFLNHPPEHIHVLTGTISPEKRSEVWNHAAVICATPQTIENDLITGKLHVQDLSLVVFDEAHKAVKEYSYVYIAQQLHQKNPHCRILALTASPGGNEEHIQEVCKNLNIQHVEIKTAQDEDVKPYVNKIEVDWIKVKLPTDLIEIRNLIQSFASEQVSFIQTLGLGKGISKSFQRQQDLMSLQVELRQRIVQEGKTNPSLFSAASKIAALLKIQHALLLLETQGITPFLTYMEKLSTLQQQSGSPKALALLMRHPLIIKSINQAKILQEKGFSHPKIEPLLTLLSDQFSLHPESRVIVFNHYRESATMLLQALSKISTIKPIRFVGQSSRSEKDIGMSQKEQQKALTEFKEGKFNVLLATSVAEEGLDIPQVDLVIFFEPIPSEIRTIQRRGRTGRKKEGKCVILMATGTRDEAYYWSSIAKEKNMHETLNSMKNSIALQEPIEKINSPQTTLAPFTESIESIQVVCDYREQASRVVKELTNLGTNVSMKQLPVADFIVSDQIAIERKSVSDFLQSLIDGRLFNQLISLSDTYDQPIMILEGSLDELYTSRNVHVNAIHGALLGVTLRYRIPILFSRDAHQTAQIIYQLAKSEQVGSDKEIKIRTGRKGLRLPEQQQFIIESLPSVGPTLAKSLLVHFGSVGNVFKASKEELQQVEKIGDKKAEAIRKVIESTYGEEEKKD